MPARLNVALAIALIAVGLPRTTPVAQQEKPAKRIALISELSGAATLQRPGAAAVPARRFDAMFDGTILRVGLQSRVLLVLGSGKRFVLGAEARATVHAERLAGTSGSIDELPSLPTLPPLAALDAKAPTALGGVRLRSNVITGLCPSDGTVLASKATLRFAPVQGAATYRIEIEDANGRVIFGIETKATEMPVPPDVLEAGVRYYWTVRTTDRPGAQARGAAHFATLSTELIALRDALKRQLSAEGDGPSIALLATIDLHLGLHQEALEGFRAALARAPNDDSLKDAVRRLEAAHASR